MRVGNAIARATSAAGVRPCGGCKKRAEALNRLFDAGARAEAAGSRRRSTLEIANKETGRVVAGRLAISFAVGLGALTLRRRLGR
jgi:hypothetical protein